MTTRELKELDIVDWLSKLGYEPQYIKGHHYWYLSPLRQEKTPSFKVNRKMNRWYDWGDGRGGNLVDFGIQYYGCSVADLLKRFASGELKASRRDEFKQASKTEDDGQIKITSIRPINMIPLIRYLNERRINEAIANQYLREIRYSLNGKNYFALGFKNDSGGFELRNQYIKGSTSPKDITFINKGAKELATFEGFFDFLTYASMYHKQEAPARNFLILNSISFFEKSLPKMRDHERVHLYLDNDPAGQKFTDLAMSLDKEKFVDQRSLYQHYNDLNDWAIHLGLGNQKLSLKL